MKYNVNRGKAQLFSVQILEVENGYVVIDGHITSLPFQNRQYVAYNADDLALLVKRLANEFKAQLSMGDI